MGHVPAFGRVPFAHLQQTPAAATAAAQMYDNDGTPQVEVIDEYDE